MAAISHDSEFLAFELRLGSGLNKLAFSRRAPPGPSLTAMAFTLLLSFRMGYLWRVRRYGSGGAQQ